MIWWWAYCIGVALFSVAIRANARHTGRPYDPTAAFMACLIWPAGVVIIAAMVIGMLVVWALRLDGKP